MMKTQKTKICEVCHECFIPDPRVGERQRVCFSLPCQQERKRRAQRRWLARNPDYFKGRYANTKAWLQAHPDYLRNYRRRRCGKAPDTISRDICRKAPLSWQDELTTSKTNKLYMARHRFDDIQDKLTSIISTANTILVSLKL